MLPDVQFFLAPPNIRNVPSWYPPYRKTILHAFQCEVLQGPNNLHLLDDFLGDLEPDGYHFNLISGMSYVKALVDQVTQILAKPIGTRKRTPLETSVSMTSALLNGVDQRVAVLESKVEFLDARLSEETDNGANERDLNRFIITGELMSLFISTYFDL